MCIRRHYFQTRNARKCDNSRNRSSAMTHAPFFTIRKTAIWTDALKYKARSHRTNKNRKRNGCHNASASNTHGYSRQSNQSNDHANGAN